MKMIKMLGIVLAIAVMSIVTQAHADYTVELKNDVGAVLKSYIVTTNQVAHLQKKANRDGASTIKQFENAIKNLIFSAQAENKVHWRRANDDYIKEQSRQ